MEKQRPTSMGLRVDDRGPAHTRVSVWVGRVLGQRGRAGTLTLRTDELDDLTRHLGPDLEAGGYEVLFSHELGKGDVLLDGGTVTSVDVDRSRHLVTAEVDHLWLREWPAYTMLRAHRPGQGGA